MMWDAIQVAHEQRIRVSILSSDAGDCRMAVALTVYAGHGGLVCGDAHGIQVMLWEPPHPFDDSHNAKVYSEILDLDNSASGSTFECTASASEGLLTVQRAVWQPPTGGVPGTLWTDSPFTGMLLEERGCIREYHCNAGRRDEGFERLVFTLELLD